MKINYEINMRWAIAEHIWKQIRSQVCMSKNTLAEDKECAEASDLWIMYKKECKSGLEAFKMSKDVECVLNHEDIKTEMNTFLGANEQVLAMLKEFNKKVEDLKKVFTNEYLDSLLVALKGFMIKEPSTSVPLTNDQAAAVIAHETLMNSAEYQEFLSFYRFWAMGVHYLRVKKYKQYAGIAAGVLLLLLLFGGGRSSGVSQTVVIRRS